MVPLAVLLPTTSPKHAQRGSWAPAAHHLGADHLTPLMTGHAPCMDLWSNWPLGLIDQNSTALPFLGLAARPFMAHSEKPAARVWLAGAFTWRVGARGQAARGCKPARAQGSVCGWQLQIELALQHNTHPHAVPTLGKTVSPPSSTSLRYINTVAMRLPPLSSPPAKLK